MSRRQVSFLMMGILLLGGVASCSARRNGRVNYVGPPPGIGPCDRCTTKGPLPPRFVPNTGPVPALPAQAGVAVPPPGAVAVPPSAASPFAPGPAAPPGGTPMAPAQAIQQNNYIAPGATPPPSPPASVPKVYLEQPEPVAANPEPRAYTPQTQEPPRASDDRAASPALPVDIPQFAAVKTNIANGQEPFPGGIAWLKSHSYRTVLHVRAPGEDDGVVRKQFEQSGLRYLSLEVSPQTLSQQTVDQFKSVVTDANNLPLFVYDKDGSLAGALWYLYFRLVDKAAEEKARADAEHLGFKQERGDAHLKMWLAAKRICAFGTIFFMDDRQSPSESFGPSTPLTPPLYPSAVYVLPDLDALDRILDAKETGFIYARDAHPNAKRLTARIAELEGARWAIATSSGMAAISAIVLAHVENGQRIVASNRLYGRTTQLFLQELPRLGVQTIFVDISDLNEVAEALQTPARLLFVETMSNPMLRMADLSALSQLAHDANCLLVVDNTFATPVLARPLDLGADFVMESATKMIGGHSDVTLGVVCSNDDMLAELSQVSSIWGFSSSPFDCWLAERGLDTLPLRMKTACSNAAALADWLAQHSTVTRVIYPGRADHPDHKLAGSLLHGGFGNMLCFDLAGGRDAVNRFLRRAPGIPFSPSLGHTTTTCSHPATTSHRYVSPAEKARQGISDGLVRLSVGVEDLALIQNEMAKGLSKA